MTTALSQLCTHGRLQWIGPELGWLAEPGEVVAALCHDGFQECKHEVARSRRDRRPAGGVWQGLNSETGSVASAIWVSLPEQPSALVFIDIDGERVQAR